MLPDKPRTSATADRITPAMLLCAGCLLSAACSLIGITPVTGQEHQPESAAGAPAADLIENARRELARGLSELYESRRAEDAEPDATGSIGAPPPKAPTIAEIHEAAGLLDPDPLGDLQGLSRPPQVPSREEAVAAPPKPEPARPRQIGRGIAAWYNLNERTASGEPFDPNALTAGHLTLPFGAKVRVVNLRNGRAVTVRINDRGPWTKGRVIDLSKAAARAIDMEGIDEVALYAVDAPSETAQSQAETKQRVVRPSERIVTRTAGP